MDNKLDHDLTVADGLHQATLHFHLFCPPFFVFNQEHCKSSPVNLSVSVHINPASVDNTIIKHLCCPDISLSFSVSLFQLVEEEKSLVMTEMEKLVALCQQLQTGAKTPVQGKTATFQKVPTLRLDLFIVLVCAYSCYENEPMTRFCPESVLFDTT